MPAVVWVTFLTLLCAPPRQSYSQVTNKCFVPPSLCSTPHKCIMILAVTAVIPSAKHSLPPSKAFQIFWEGNFSPNLLLVQFFPSILKPRNFQERFNGCKDPVGEADQSRLGAKICSQKAKELSKHSIQWLSAKITSTYFAGRSSKQDQDRMLTRQVWPALRHHMYSKYLRFMS